MRRVIIALMAAALLLPLAALAQMGHGGGAGCGQGRGMGMGDRPDGPGMGKCGGDGPGIGHFLQMAEQLGLTDQQREQFKKMQTEFKLQMIDKDAAVEKADVQLRSAMMDDKTSEAEVGRLIDQVAKLRADVQKARYSHQKQMKGVLTAEQLTKSQELRKTCMKKGEAGCKGKGMGQDRDDDEEEGEEQGKG
jgi:Spy/CpxP family protein refolding chaperone